MSKLREYATDSLGCLFDAVDGRIEIRILCGEERFRYVENKLCTSGEKRMKAIVDQKLSDIYNIILYNV